MNVTRWTATTVICHLILSFVFACNLQAQTKVALIDIGLIFKNHPEFSNSLSQLKGQADQFKAEAQQLQQQLMRKAEGLAQYEKDSEEYRDQEALLAKESATMEVDQRTKMRDLLKQEAQVHFDTYVEISGVISQYCEEYGIQLVLRFNSEEMNPKDPKTVMQQVNGGVIHYAKSADITNEIIKRIAQAKGQASAGGTLNR